MYDDFHSFVCGDCWNLGDFAGVEWGKNCAVLPSLLDGRESMALWG
jgi:hypothetical protein